MRLRSRRSLPIDLNAEQALLGCMLLNDGAIDDIATAIDASHFYEQLHRQIFEVLIKVVRSGAAAPLTTVLTYLPDGQMVEDRSVAQYLHELVDRGAEHPNALAHASRIRDLATRRDLIAIGEDIANFARKPPADADATTQVDDAYTRLSQLRAQAGARRRFKLMRFDDVMLPTAANYLVKGLLPRQGLAVVWGPPKCGKSFWVFDLLMHVALGWSYRGLRVTQGAVVYLVLEGADGFKARISAFRQRHLAEEADRPVPFFMIPTRIDLIKDVPDLIRDIHEQLGDVIPAAVAIDTLNRSLVGSESSDEDMAAYLKAAEVIGDAFGCLVTIVHHSGVAGDRPRGHTSLTGTTDVQIAVSRGEHENIIAELEFVKDGPQGLVLASRLEVVEIGVDEDGDAITSCVIIQTEAQPSGKVSHRKRPTGRAALVLEAAREAISALPGEPPPSNHIPPRVSVTTRANVAEYARRKGFAEGGTPASFRAAFSTVVSRLIGDGHLGHWNDGTEAKGTSWIWLAE